MIKGFQYVYSPKSKAVAALSVDKGQLPYRQAGGQKGT